MDNKTNKLCKDCRKVYTTDKMQCPHCGSVSWELTKDPITEKKDSSFGSMMASAADVAVDVGLAILSGIGEAAGSVASGIADVVSSASDIDFGGGGSDIDF